MLVPEPVSILGPGARPALSIQPRISVSVNVSPWSVATSMFSANSAPAGAFFALNMLVATDHGDTFTEAEIRGWMAKAGLAGGPRIDTGTGASIVVGLGPSRR